MFFLAVFHTAYLGITSIILEVYRAEKARENPKIYFVSLKGLAKSRAGLSILVASFIATRNIQVAVVAGYAVEVISTVSKEQLIKAASGIITRIRAKL
jgi:hypothetical protein